MSLKLENKEKISSLSPNFQTKSWVGFPQRMHSRRIQWRAKTSVTGQHRFLCFPKAISLRHSE